MQYKKCKVYEKMATVVTRVLKTCVIYLKNHKMYVLPSAILENGDSKKILVKFLNKHKKLGKVLFGKPTHLNPFKH